MLPQFTDNPFHLNLSFDKVIEGLENVAATDTGWQGDRARKLLPRLAQHPELREGITSEEEIEENTDLIADLFADMFPTALTLNEIKAVAIPYQGIVFNHTQRFKNILKEAGTDFKINIRDFDGHQFYVFSCCMVLNSFFGTQLDFMKPLFYDIPTKDGIERHYRILFNADFIEVVPTETSIMLTQQDIDELLDNFDNLALWKEKFPPGSWILKGFGLMSLIDVTVENALSTLKSNLLGSYSAPDMMEKLESIFRSIFRVSDVRMGFTLFDPNEDKFNNNTFGLQVNSYLLCKTDMADCHNILGGPSYKNIIEDRTYFAVSDVDEFTKQHPDSMLGEHFKKQGVQSFILAPVIKNGTLLGILELVSSRKKELNSVNANKLEIVMPFLIDTIDRKIHDMQNRVQAVIQDNYTTLHPSVNWKFRREAQNYIHNANSGLAYTLKEITFGDVYPLYGQVDISESSVTRNLSVRNDLGTQLNELLLILEQLNVPGSTTEIEQMLFDVQTFAGELALNIRADTEQFIQNYLETRAYPILRSALANKNHAPKIEQYFEDAEPINGIFYTHRRNYDLTLSLINQKLATILDSRQAEIQDYFPHYYERFKTDGVEHNMYIGSSISPKYHFKMDDLRRLRLWQLRVIAEMEIEQHDLKSILPYQLSVTSLILVFSTPIDIRFRMDEKHFDVDGAYNIRYEVIKKRIDKAHIKGTEERVTKPGTITIIYSKAEEKKEYTGYIKLLQQAGILADKIEYFEVEDLQGVSGLKALRVGILHQQNLLAQRAASYTELYAHLD